MFMPEDFSQYFLSNYIKSIEQLTPEIEEDRWLGKGNILSLVLILELRLISPF